MSITERISPTARRHGVGFWLIAVAFLVNMAFSAVPTPIYGLYEHRDHFGAIVVTLIYAVYAVGVITSLFLAGHLSDRFGRRRILVPALAIDVVSAGIFILFPSVAGLMLARVVNGVSVGLTTATATSYLLDLHRHARPGADTRRADIVAAAANLGGIGVGPLVAGVLLAVAGDPLRLAYIVFAVALAILAVLLTRVPETVTPPRPRPAYRPQRVAVPRRARKAFFAAAGAGMAAFAVFGVFNSLAPGFLVGSLHDDSHVMAGLIAFVAFAAAALAQAFQVSSSARTLLIRGVPILLVGLGLLVAAMWVASLAMFLAGGLVVGAGGGMVFKGALVTAAEIAPDDRRAEVLAGYFLGAYVGLSIPVVALGVATTLWPAREVMVIFGAIVAAATVLAVRVALASGSEAGDGRRQVGGHLRRAGRQAPERRTGAVLESHQEPAGHRGGAVAQRHDAQGRVFGTEAKGHRDHGRAGAQLIDERRHHDRQEAQGPGVGTEVLVGVDARVGGGVEPVRDEHPR